MQSEKEKAAKDFAVEFHIEYGNREAEDEVIAEAIYLLERGFLAGWDERDKKKCLNCGAIVREIPKVTR